MIKSVQGVVYQEAPGACELFDTRSFLRQGAPKRMYQKSIP